LGKKRFKDRVLVLMYHRVVSEQDKSHCLSHDGIIVSKAAFERQMRFLRDRFNVLSLNDFIDCIEGRKAFSYKSCLVTFDDGWKDNFQNAYPVLKEIGIPAVIFLTTDFVGKNELFWQERITELLCELHDVAIKDGNFMDRLRYKLPDREIERIIKSPRGNLKGEIHQYISILKKTSKEEIESIIQRLSELTGKSGNGDSTEKAFMNWDEIRVMAGTGISFGSHGKSHAILTRLEKHEVEKEAIESRALMEENLGTPVFSFSYPNGDYSEEVAEIVKHSGYRVAFATDRGSQHANDRSFKIRRINIHEDMTDNIPMFMARIVGLW
jgi:peptidoglycan/xylan/chitin deacetylase (PgdA/CDA1 family)